MGLEEIITDLTVEVERLTEAVDLAESFVRQRRAERDRVRKALDALSPSTAPKRVRARGKASAGLSVDTVNKVFAELPGDTDFTVKEAQKAISALNPGTVAGAITRMRDEGMIRLVRKDGMAFVYRKVES